MTKKKMIRAKKPKKTASKKPLSTYDEHMLKLTPKERKAHNEGYKELLLSELVLAAMQDDDVSVRELAKAAGISPTIVQEVRAGKRKNLTLQSFLKLLDALGYSLVLEKAGKSKSKQERITYHSPYPIP